MVLIDWGFCQCSLPITQVKETQPIKIRFLPVAHFSTKFPTYTFWRGAKTEIPAFFCHDRFLTKQFGLRTEVDSDTHLSCYVIALGVLLIYFFK